MNYYLLNGSPRKNKNTAKLLEAAKEGIQDTIKELKSDEEVSVEIIDLFSLNYKGCMSCFNCKLIDGPFYGQCPINDDLKDLLPKLWDSDGIIIASPIYFSDVTGQTRNLVERLSFPKLVYGGDSLQTRKIPSAFFLTMNVSKELYEDYYAHIEPMMKTVMEVVTQEPQILKAYNTVQFDDYSKYENYIFSEEEKIQYEKDTFQDTLNKSYNIGKEIAQKSLK